MHNTQLKRVLTMISLFQNEIIPYPLLEYVDKRGIQAQAELYLCYPRELTGNCNTSQYTSILNLFPRALFASSFSSMSECHQRLLSQWTWPKN